LRNIPVSNLPLPSQSESLLMLIQCAVGLAGGLTEADVVCRQVGTRSARTHGAYRFLLCVIVTSCCMTCSPTARAADVLPEVAGLLDKIGVARGLCVVLGDDPGQTALDLARASDLIIYVQSPKPQVVAAVRRAADQAGLLGRRVWVQQGGYQELHLADDL